MKQEQQLFSGITASLMTLLLMVFNCQCVYAHNKSDSFIYNNDLNNLLSNTKLVQEIEVNRSRSRNQSKAKRDVKKVASNNPAKPQLVNKTNNAEIAFVSEANNSVKKVVEKKSSSYDISNYDASIIYQSEIILIEQSKLESFRTVFNESGITRLNISSPIKNQFVTNFLNGKLANIPPVSSDPQPANKQKNYWATLHFIESSSGKKLYRKRNKARSCKWTTTPCGHHQLSVQALKDIGCKSLKCRSARENYKKSLSMSKQLEEINAERMKKKGHKSLPEYQRYLVHQQGATGLGRILDAYKGKKKLSKKTLKYMANNSPYSYKTLRRSGSRGAARKFLHHWEEKWKVNHSQRIVSR